MEFKLENDHSLYLRKNNLWLEVELKNCFPDSRPDQFFSIRDDSKKEICLLKSLDELDEVNRKVIETYLKFKNFLYEIKGIYTIDEEFGVRHWDVETLQGRIVFQTELDLWPEESSSGGIVIRDIYADQYQINSLDFGADILARYC